MHKPNPDTIARLLNQAGEHLKEALRHPTAGHVDMAAPHVDAAMHCIHQAFQETIGGAAYARPEPTPQPAAPAAARPHVFAVRIVDEGEVPGDTCRAVTQFMEPRQPPAPSDERTVVVGGRRLRVVLRGPCYLDAPIADCGVRAVVVDDDVAAPKAEPAAPAAVAGWVVKDITPGDPRPFLGVRGWRAAPTEAVPFSKYDAAYNAAGKGKLPILPVDAAGNVLEERAPAPDVVAQCRAALASSLWEDSEAALRAVVAAAEPTPAPREPDGWVVVGIGDRMAGPAWLDGEDVDIEREARDVARNRGVGWTARPFWLDTPPVHPSSLTDVVTTLEDERNTLRAEVDRLTRERDEARLGGVCHALGCMVEAYELGGASASKLAEMLGYHVGELHGSGLQAVANMIFEAATELPQALALARQCHVAALGERERIAGALERDAAQFAAAYDVPGDVTPTGVRNLPAPTLPEVP